MKVLVACEESQAVTIELRKLGHEERSIIRSKTFPGIAEAMASQWTDASNKNIKERSELN